MLLHSFSLDSCKVSDCEKKFQKNSIMADFWPEKEHFWDQIHSYSTLFLSIGCCISPGFAFIGSVHMNAIALWQKFARKIYNGGFWLKKGVFLANFMVLALFLSDCCSKSPCFGINTSVHLRCIALKQKYAK